MRKVGQLRVAKSPDQIESLGCVLNDLLGFHFAGLGVGQIVPTSFAHRKYEAEIVHSEQGRTAWLHVTEEEVHRVAEGDRTVMRDSLTKFFQSVGFTK